MFVHSGAALHRHEYSTPLNPQSTSISQRSPLRRSAFSTPVTPSTHNYHEKPTPILRRTERPVSDYNSQPYDHSVRFKELEADVMSEDGRSIADSDRSGTTAGHTRRRKPIRTGACFQLAYPAPTLTQKQKLLCIRPKLLLQLQQISPNSRPRPVIDVLPSTIVVPRLVKKFTRIFRGNGELGANDVMVVKSEAYDSKESHEEGSDTDDEEYSKREIIAAICQARKAAGGSLGKAEIVLDDGSLWSATPVNPEFFEFVSVDDQGNTTTVRWVKRKGKSVDSSESDENSMGLKFSFSIIDRNTRQHAVMATLTSTVLDIPDYYTSTSSSSENMPPRPSQECAQPTGSAESKKRREHIYIDERTRVLIQVTAIWVALRRNWCPCFTYNDTMVLPSSSSRSRSASMNCARVNAASSDAMLIRQSSMAPSESGGNAFAVIGDKIRQTCTKGSPAASIKSTIFEKHTSITPKRAVSTGSAFMQRAAARKAGNAPSAVISEKEGPLSTTVASNSHTLNPGGSPATTIDTPTRPPRRVRSLHVASSEPRNVVPQHDRQSSELASSIASKSKAKPKASRWEAFSKFFRRGGGCS